MKFDLACALWDLGMLPVERLPAVAQDALMEGVNSSQICILASLTKAEAVYEGREYFAGALQEIGRHAMSKADAAIAYARSICSEIVQGQLDAIEGARLLWDVSLQVDEPDFHELDPFIYAASECEDRPSERSFFVEAIKREAVKRLSPGADVTP